MQHRIRSFSWVSTSQLQSVSVLMMCIECTQRNPCSLRDFVRGIVSVYLSLLYKGSHFNPVTRLNARQYLHNSDGSQNTQRWQVLNRFARSGNVCYLKCSNVLKLLIGEIRVNLRLWKDRLWKSKHREFMLTFRRRLRTMIES
jgi:hypothetical protein